MSAKIPQRTTLGLGRTKETPYPLGDTAQGDQGSGAEGCPQWLNLWQRKAPVTEVVRKDTVSSEAGPFLFCLLQGLGPGCADVPRTEAYRTSSMGCRVPSPPPTS